MKNFLITTLKFASIGGISFILLLIGYAWLDPFKVLHTYDNYSYCNVIPNRDYISTEVFLKNKDKYHYNSFIFGSSRALAFRTDSWKKYLKRLDSPFAFDASGESVYGMYTKLKWMDSIHTKIDNVLLVIDEETTFNNTDNDRSLLFIKHPATSGESWYEFHKIFLKAYFDPQFLIRFYTFTFTHQYQDWMKGYIEWRKIRYDPIDNQSELESLEKEISQDPDAYYSMKKKAFFTGKGEQTDTLQRIKEKQLFMLQEIVRILDKNHTNYKVIISPIYNQVKFSDNDRKILNHYFGNHLYDFSGKNSMTDNTLNYYDPGHFRPIVGDSILWEIYH